MWVNVCVWRHQVFFLTAPYLTYLESQGVSIEHSLPTGPVCIASLSLPHKCWDYRKDFRLPTRHLHGCWRPQLWSAHLQRLYPQRYHLSSMIKLSLSGKEKKVSQSVNRKKLQHNKEISTRRRGGGK